MSRHGIGRRLHRLVFGFADRPIARKVEELTATATCAAGCNQPVWLAGPHYRIDRCAIVAPTEEFDTDPLVYLHLDCWPTTNCLVVITADVAEPERSTLTVDWDGDRS